MGLTLVRRLVELHDGAITASSPGPGGGSEFVVRLPLSSSPPPGVAVPPAAGSTGPRRDVLVIEDHDDSRESLCLLLREWGHAVREAEDGVRGLAELLSSPPEVAFVDIGLPGRDGYSLAQAVRTAPGGDRICLVALTGYGQSEDRRRAEEAGFDRHLVKPVDDRQLLELLASLPRHDGGGDR